MREENVSGLGNGDELNGRFYMGLGGVLVTGREKEKDGVMKRG